MAFSRGLQPRSPGICVWKGFAMPTRRGIYLIAILDVPGIEFHMSLYKTDCTVFDTLLYISCFLSVLAIP